MQVKEIDGYTARCEAKGVFRDASLLLVEEEEIRVGDFVMIHLGYVMRAMTEDEARMAWAIYDEMLHATPS